MRHNRAITHIPRESYSMRCNASAAQRGRRRKFNKASQVIAAAASSSLVLLGATAVARAASGTWSGAAGDGLWQTPTNWDTVPGAVGTTNNTDTASFVGNPATSQTVAIDANRNIGSILFNPDPNPTATTTFVIGATGPNGGNPLILTNGGSITLASITPTIQLVNTVNAPLVLAGSAYSLVNNGTDASNLSGLHFFGSIKP